ncbi:MAG: DNA mismatch repair endonuclease MutL [Lachnospira sp.]|nr:DNA mismatch repair endonuclease MutL [Lachnospira sp.]
MSIQLLDENTINKIAAGEVIERPSSVVKELVENAIDAKATAITVEIKEGGISFIRVTDNGTGINGNEISMAFERHATSKIKSIEDLITVSSLGFRGEALASIAAVSQVELITKTKESFNGYRYICEGGEEKSIEEIGAPEGTTFIVRNLFYNTPVRRKFLKTATTEASYVNSLIQYLSLSHPDISFRFISNNQNKLHTSGNMNLKDIIYNVYGRDITANLIELNAKTQDVEISGFIGKPMICRGNRSYENYYINGRYIKSGIITKAIEEGFKGFIMPHNYPFTAIHFKINPSIIDVNVHPTKMELRFSKNDFIYNFVLDTIVSALRNRELAVEATLPDALNAATKDNVAKSDVIKEKVNEVKDNFVKNNTVENLVIEKKTEKNIVNENKAVQNTFTKNTAVPDETLENVVNTNTVTENKSSLLPKESSVQQTLNQPVLKKEYNERLPEPFEIKRSDDLISEDEKAYEARKQEEVKKEYGQQMSFVDDKLLDKNAVKPYRIIGQLFETYWLIEFEDKFYMMDQHAAHEKILYERTMKHLKEKTMDSQMIMPPVILSLSMREEEILNEYMPVFSKLGYEIESFGGNEYKVTGIPAGLPRMDYKQLLIDLIDNLIEEGPSKNLEIITDRVATMSCKAAVKGNNRLSFEEAKELISELMEAENPYNCPHGRPTLIVMSKYEIEKKFKRII